MSTANRKQNQSEENERQKETSKAAQKALEAQEKAKELAQAAAGAADPDEHQKLLNQALEKAIEAENFGKTAKYLNTGAFQGLCAGAGLGTGIGVSLGVVVGTLVGGTTSLVTGGLGAGLGLGIGAAHGPWFKLGDMMGEGIRKVIGDFPGWKATEEQKSALERMVNGVREQEKPGEEELVRMTEGGGKIVVGKGYVGRKKEDEAEKGVLRESLIAKNSGDQKNRPKSTVQGHGTQNVRPGEQAVGMPSELAGQAVTTKTVQSKVRSPDLSKPHLKKTSPAARNTSRKPQPLDGPHSHAEILAEAPSKPRRQPRKLEIRSA